MSFLKQNIALLFTLAILLVSFTLQVNATSTTTANNIVKVVNKLRAKHHAPAVKWDKTLASYAQKWSNKCDFKHSGGPYGENLAYGYSTFTAAINAWYDEVKDYDYDKPGFSSATGHFTALVWKSTTKIGCGVKTCDNLFKGAKLYTCSFSPAGNIVGANNKYFIQNVVEP